MTVKRQHRHSGRQHSVFSIAEIAVATGGRIIGNAESAVTAVSTDSRTVRPGELFVPLHGASFDGHSFIETVTAQGVATVVAEEVWLKRHTVGDAVTVIAVKNSLRALCDLAAFHRRRFELPVIAVTGSNGKTTAKEMLAAVLEQTGTGLKTEGNLNNLIGLPQMIFRMRQEHCWAVLEMGMSEPGEIDRLAEIAQPRVGIVLNAFPAHLASMGTVEAVAKAKGELLHRIQDNGLAVVNADDPRVASLPQNSSARRISFGISRGEVRAEEIELLGLEGQSFRLVTPKGNIRVELKAFGRHAVFNALATAAALLEKVSLETIASGLAAFRPYNGRFRVEKTGSLVLIDDSYNANPASTSAALSTLADLKGSGKAFVALGDMLELGRDEVELHKQLGMQAAAVADRLYLVGSLTSHAAQAACESGMSAEAILCSNDHAAISEDILRHAVEGDLVLIKGSRGMRMEKIADAVRSMDSQGN